MPHLPGQTYSLKNLRIEPYRPFFFVGAIMAILMLTHWFTVLELMRVGDSYAAVTRSVYQVHAQEMYYCIFAYFAFGFLLTAFPRFIEMPHPPARLVVIWVGALLASEVLLMFGLLWPVWFYASAALQLVVYSSLLIFLIQRFRRSLAPWREQPRLILIAFAFGLLGSLVGNLALIHVEWVRLRALSVQIGLYGFIIFLIFAITWRVVPFMSSRAIPGYEIKRGRYSGMLILTLIVVRLVLTTLTALFPEMPFRAEIWCWTVDTLILGVYAREIIRWQPWRATAFPPLFILYLGLFWLFVFLAVSPMRLLARLYFPELDLFFLTHDKNVLHIFNLGTFGTLILAIASRVTRGHGGLSLRFDIWMGISLLLMQAAMVIRVLNIYDTMHYAALLWVGAFTIWAWRHLPILLQAPLGKET